MKWFLFLFTIPLLGSHHHKHSHSRDTTSAKVAPIDHYRVHIYQDEIVEHLNTPPPRSITPPLSPFPTIPQNTMDIPITEDTRVKLALIGLGSSVISAAVTALAMWASRSC